MDIVIGINKRLSVVNDCTLPINKIRITLWAFYNLHGGKMKKLRLEYWDYFTKKGKGGKTRGDGIKFEGLVKCLLAAQYGIEWIGTQKSYDDNRDFWIYFKEKHLWAECKNYKDSIA